MVLSIGRHALMITSFVFVMMLLIEYVNVQTQGRWQHSLQRGRWKQYLIAALLGVTPGCLGAFTVVSLYTHRVVGFGALVAAMIATSGDEAYVMLSLFPLRTLLLTVILLAIGVVAGYLTDLVFKSPERLLRAADDSFEVHPMETCRCFQLDAIVRQLREISLQRALLLGILGAFVIALMSGVVRPGKWNWIEVTLLVSTLLAAFVVSTVPDHFLEEHLWEHVFKKHAVRILAWTFGVLLVIHALDQHLDLDAWIRGNILVTLVIASLAGLIPESGPHLVFVTLFADGTIPFSVLLANSIVQDGHGALPLLASSKRAFLVVKVVNLVIGCGLGILVFLLGW